MFVVVVLSTHTSAAAAAVAAAATLITTTTRLRNALHCQPPFAGLVRIQCRHGCMCPPPPMHARELYNPICAFTHSIHTTPHHILAACCCCWHRLRNAAHYQPSLVAHVFSRISAALVACVIAFGPVLGVVAAAVVFGSPGNLSAMQHGQHIRVASSAVRIACIVLEHM